MSAKLSIIPLGGLGEIGKNMTVIKYGNNIIVVDAGLSFPEDEMLGVDVVIPDITYLLENKQLVRAIILTHGHEDHIGALPYILKDLNVPVYGTRLTLSLLEQKLMEAYILDQAKLVEIKAGDTVNIGPFEIEFIRVSHSIPDVVALGIKTPAGTIVHTADFKIDHTPIDGEVTDFHKFAQLGKEGVLVLLSDSTNAEREGYTMSEKNVGENFDDIFSNAKGRIIVASFASNIHRLQQIFLTAYKHGRKVAVCGRSMQNTVEVASELGYLDIPPNTLIDLDSISQLPNKQIVVISTGSQGEPMSALSRIAKGEHKKVQIEPGDTIVISANPIPGNEKMIAKTIDQLFQQGAEVIYEEVFGVHVSGHASQEELKLMINLIRPKYFMPIHGEYRMLVKHAQIAEELGIPSKNIIVAENGQVIEFGKNGACISGRVTTGQVMVDGLGVGDVGNIVLRDRQQLSQYGILIVVLTLEGETGEVLAGPDIISRGFVYVRESEELLEEARQKVEKVLEKCKEANIKEWSVIKGNIKDVLSKFLFERTHRKPMILPIIMEV
ncbi:MAG: ribonuclease J [Clostridia bacterium]|nr:ribonuclease J [Clostridia bacterium]